MSVESLTEKSLVRVAQFILSHTGGVILPLPFVIRAADLHGAIGRAFRGDLLER